MADDMKELGNSGLKISGGQVGEEALLALRGPQGRRTLREMADNCPITGGVLFAFEQTLNRLDWHIEPGPDAEKDDEATAEFVQGAFDDMSDPWGTTLSSIMSCGIYGWSFHEIVYKKRNGLSDDPTQRSAFDDGKIGWRKWPIRAQDSLISWLTDPNGGVQGMRQMTDMGGDVTIPIEKALLFRTNTAKGSPEGRSLLRNAYRSYYYKKRIEEIEAIGIERDLAGLPVAYLDPEFLSSTATPGQVEVRQAVTEIVQNIKRNEMEGVLFPLAYNDQGNQIIKLELLSSGGSRQFDTDKIIARYNQQIAMSVLADFLLLGHEGVGSQALGASKIDLWLMAVEAIAKNVADVVNQHAIPRLLRLNGMDTTNPPRLVYGEVGHLDLKLFGDFIKSMADAGVITPDATLEDFVREKANLPQADVDETEDMGADPQITPEMAAAAALAAAGGQQPPQPPKPGQPKVDPADAAAVEGEAGELDPSAA
ncbi:portal protein [Arthrobacter phage Wheelbite]|uniref:Portal protein n=1 Tax=Arthrobacter phage Wheelbite TaxID=2015873 RepID=A0A222ZIE1_9CAUD|nr:portal protein [Arthrobacter phage Wheelbite]ASR84109.1 portal protein [Arthrobacter phage Wheelbite]